MFAALLLARVKTVFWSKRVGSLLNMAAKPGFINHHVRGIVVNGRIEGENRAEHLGILKGKAESSHSTARPALNRASLLRGDRAVRRVDMRNHFCRALGPTAA